MPPIRVEDRTTTLVAAHQAEIWRYLRYLGCPAVEAEDLTQETFLAVLRSPFEDRGPIRAAAYLRTVARNLFLKARARTPLAIAAGFAEAEAAEVAWQRFAGRDGGEGYLAALRECLAQLDGRGRDAVNRRYEAGQSRSQIAAELGLSVDGVKSLLRRVRDILRECVERRIET